MKYLYAAFAIAALVVLLSCSEKGTGAETTNRGSAPGTSGDSGETATAELVSGLVGGSTGAAGDEYGSSSAFSQWPVWPEPGDAEDRLYSRLTCRTLVYSTIEEVWLRITTVSSFVLWYPPWKCEGDLRRRLQAVGDTLCYRMGANEGRSVVTWYERLKELRIVHEFEDGSWGGSLHFRLKEAARGIGLEVQEIIPSSGIDVAEAKGQLCKRVVLIKRLSEGE